MIIKHTSPGTIAAFALSSCGNPGSPTVSRADAPVQAFTLERQPGSWTYLHYTMAFDATGVSGGRAELVKAGEAGFISRRAEW